MKFDELYHLRANNWQLCEQPQKKVTFSGAFTPLCLWERDRSRKSWLREFRQRSEPSVFSTEPRTQELTDGPMLIFLFASSAPVCFISDPRVTNLFLGDT